MMKSNNYNILPILFAGPISYYALWLEKVVILDVHETFTKQTYRNRARIYGANGILNISVPVKKGANSLPMGEVQISYVDDWQRIAWKTLESAYKNSPFFEYYSYLFEPLFNTKHALLIDFNVAFHKVVAECLQLNFDYSFSDDFTPYLKNDPRAIYSQKNKSNPNLQYPDYQQVFSYEGPFEPDLSILDGIFNLGPELAGYLSQVIATKNI